MYFFYIQGKQIFIKYLKYIFFLSTLNIDVFFCFLAYDEAYNPLYKLEVVNSDACLYISKSLRVGCRKKRTGEGIGGVRGGGDKEG